MYKLNQIKLNIHHSDEDLKKKITKLINVSVDDIDWSTLIILHKAIDARDKKNTLFVYNVAFDFVDDGAGVVDSVGASSTSPKIKIAKSKLEKYEAVSFDPIVDHRVRNPQAIAPTKKSVDHTSTSEENSNALERPIVVGFGPAGIFASYILALNGLKPIIVERGKSLDDRTKDVNKFFETMELDEESNVCFGEGGAGAFSDGKLNTNNKDKTGIYHFVLETFVKFGADKKILYENLPHIGTDKLVGVIKNIRDEIIRLGGEIYYNTKMTFDGGLLKFAPTNAGVAPANAGVAPTNDGTHIAPTITKDTPVILAIGNSSRDTFRELIDNGFDVKAKAIAVGYRIAHRQSFINNAQYGVAHVVRDDEKRMVQGDGGKMISAPIKVGSQCVAPTMSAFAHMEGVERILGPATYKLTYDVGNGHSVYSFCMCPGGYIINSSNYKGMLSINGMSYNNRNGRYANSAIVETIRPCDVAHIVKGDDGRMIFTPMNEGSQCIAPTNAGIVPMRDCNECSPLQMLEFQERVEKAAFELEKGFIPYVTSGCNDICNEEVFKGQAKYCERLKSVYENCGLKFDINKDIEMALKHFNRVIPGFFGKGSQCVAPTDAAVAPTDAAATTIEYVIAGVETRTSSPVKLDRDENYMCNVPNFYPCGEGLGHGGGIMSCAVDGINVAIAVAKKMYSD